jgi:hypothetical protein
LGECVADGEDGQLLEPSVSSGVGADGGEAFGDGAVGKERGHERSWEVPFAVMARELAFAVHHAGEVFVGCPAQWRTNVIGYTFHCYRFLLEAY